MTQLGQARRPSVKQDEIPGHNRLLHQLPLYGVMSAAGFSRLGNAVVGVALPWLVLDITGSAALTGVAAAAATGPLVIGAFFGGPLIDRLGSRIVAVTADILSATTVAIVAALMLIDQLGIWALMALILVGALLDGPGMTAPSARLPDLAKLARVPLERVTAIDELLESTAVVFGPPLAGLAVVLVGLEATLYVTAACSLVAACLNAVSLPRDRRKQSEQPPLSAGARFLLGDPLLRTVLALTTLMIAIFAALTAVVMPTLLRSVDGSALDLGLFLATAGGGAAIAAVTFGIFGHRADGRLVLIFSLAGAVIALAGITLVAPGLWLLVCAATLGLATGALGPLLNTLFLRRAPAKIRGSVFGASTAAALSATPVAVLFAGVAVEVVGPTSVLWVLAGAMALLTAVATVAPALRRLSPAMI
jgi:macrolide resistance protein